MNYQERKVSYYLLVVQGTYYVVLGLAVLFSELVPTLYSLEHFPRSVYLTTLTALILLNIGAALFLARNIAGPNISSCVLGFFIAFSFLLHHSIFLYQFDTSRFLWIDWLMQFAFLLCWIWLLYWKWIERKFEDI